MPPRPRTPDASSPASPVVHRALRGVAAVLVLTAVVLLLALGLGPAPAPSARAAPTLAHLHSSSHLGESPESLAADLARWRARNDLITLTEVATDARGAALDAPGWGTWWASGQPRAENAVLWDEQVWELLEGWHQQVTAQRAYTGRGSYPIGWAATVLLRHRATGRPVLVSALHLPSLVERPDGTGFRREDNPLRVATYEDAMRGWRAHVDDLRARFDDPAVMLSADWNIDLRRWWARRWLRREWSSSDALWNPTWRRPYPVRGTLEDYRLGAQRHRLIDASLVAGVQRLSRPRIGPDAASSDHHPVRELWSLG